MAKKTLTRSEAFYELSARVNYDPATGEVTWREKAGPVAAGTRVGGIDTYGHRQVPYRGNAIAIHRLIWFIVTGELLPPEITIDHINGNAGDNRWANLRKCSHKQNCWNRKKSHLQRNPHSKFKGVTKDKGRWSARIRAGKPLYLGSFSTEKDAALAYDAAALALHGVYAQLNFPVPNDTK